MSSEQIKHLEEVAKSLEAVGAIQDASMCQRTANELKAERLEKMAAEQERHSRLHRHTAQRFPSVREKCADLSSACASDAALFREAAAHFRKQNNIEWVPFGKTEMVAHYKDYWLSCRGNTWQVFAVTKTSLRNGHVRFDEDPKAAAVAWVDEITKGAPR